MTAPFTALPDANPRLPLLIELTAELRLCQAVRAQRSDLVLGPIGRFGLGRFVVQGRGKKHGEVVDLHPELRAVADEVLSVGDLSEAEAALPAGTPFMLEPDQMPANCRDFKEFAHIVPTSERAGPAGNRTRTIAETLAASRTMPSRLRAAFS